MINYLRKGLILKIMGEGENPGLSEGYLTGLTDEEIKVLKKQIDNFEEQDLRKILTTFLEAQNKMKYSSIPQLPLELAIIEITES